MDSATSALLTADVNFEEEAIKKMKSTFEHILTFNEKVMPLWASNHFILMKISPIMKSVAIFNSLKSINCDAVVEKLKRNAYVTFKETGRNIVVLNLKSLIL